MRDDSLFGREGIMFCLILLLFVATSNAKPLAYEDVDNLLPTVPQTTNDTLAAIVQDSVVQDAVEDAVGNGSLEGLVVKKKVFVIPATEPTKVVSQREQILVVPMTNLEDVKKNITETVNAKTDADGLVDVTSFTEDDEKNGQASSRDDFYEALTEISEATRKPTFPVDNTSREIPYFLPNPGPREMELPEQPSPVISVPIVALLDPARISDDKIDVPIAASLPKRDDTMKDRLNLLEEERDEIRRNVQNFVDGNTRRIDPDKLTSSRSSEIPISPLPVTKGSHYANDIHPANSIPLMPRIDIVRPLLWIADADANYPIKNSNDMDAAADGIVFRPLFRFRQQAQQQSWRRGIDAYRSSAYRRYNSYPRRDYRYKPQYSDDDYY